MIQKILSCILLAATLIASVLAEAWEQPSQEELALREKVIKDMAAEYARPLYPHRFQPEKKIVFRGRMDRGVIRLVPSNEAQLERNVILKNIKPSEAHQLINTRTMALASLSAGGILYFFPGQKIFFWETSSKNVTEESFQDGVLMNPMIGGLLNGVLSRLQKDVRKDSIMMVVLNPADAFVQATNRMARRRVLVSGTTEIRTVDQASSTRPQNMDQPPKYLGLQFQIRF